jgi:hypothetical protein
MTADLLHLRDYAPLRRVYGPPDAPVAIIVMPVVRVERAEEIVAKSASAVRRSLLGDAE